MDSPWFLMKSSASCSTVLSVVSSTSRSWDLTSSQSATSHVFDSKRKKYSAGSIVMRRPSTWMPGRRLQRGSNASGSSTVMALVSMVGTVSPSLIVRDGHRNARTRCGRTELRGAARTKGEPWITVAPFRAAADK